MSPFNLSRLKQRRAFHSRKARFSLYAQLLIVLALVGTVGTSVALYQTDRTINELAKREAVRDAKVAGKHFERALIQAGITSSGKLKQSDIKRALDGVPLEQDLVGVELWSESKTLLYRNGKKEPAHYLTPAVIEALGGSISISGWKFGAKNIATEKLVEVYYPIRNPSGRQIAALGIYYSPESLNETLGTLRKQLIVTTFCLGLGVALLIWLVLRQTLFKQLGRLIKNLRSLASDYPSSTWSRYGSEFEQAAEAIEEMAERRFHENTLAQEATERWKVEARARNVELEAIQSLVQAVFSSPDPKDITCKATRIITDSLGGDMGSVMVLEESREFVAYACTVKGRDETIEANCDQDPLENHSRRMIRCLRRQEFLNTRNPYTEAECSACKDAACAAGFTSMLCVPLVIKGRALGIVTQYFERTREWSPTQLRFASLLANAVAISLEASELLESSRTLAADYATQAHQLAAINEISKVANSRLDISAAMEELTRHLRELLQFDEARLGLIDRRKKRLSSRRLGPENNVPVEIAYAVVERVTREATPIFSEAVQEDPLFKGAALYKAGCRSALAVPVFSKGQPVGALALGRKDGRPFRPQEARLVELVAEQIGISLENARLYEELKSLAESLERKVDRRTKELALAVERRARFLNMISHDLRTPLNAILGFSELLSDPSFGSLDERQRSFIKRINEGGGHLLRLVNDILDLARVDAGRLTLSPESFLISDGLGSAIELVDSLAKAKSIPVKLTVDPELNNMIADPGRFKQILNNLLSNAIKYSPEGSAVRVEAVKRGSTVEISVNDNGYGIDPDDFPRLFSEFERVERSEAMREQGTGLGLPLTKRLVEIQGGKIWFESAPGEGSTFAFSLPLDGKASARKSGRPSRGLAA